MSFHKKVTPGHLLRTAGSPPTHPLPTPFSQCSESDPPGDGLVPVKSRDHWIRFAPPQLEATQPPSYAAALSGLWFNMVWLPARAMNATWGLVTVLSLVCQTESRCSPTTYYKNCWIRRFPGIFINMEESQRRGAQLLRFYQEESALKCSRSCCLTRNCRFLSPSPVLLCMCFRFWLSSLLQFPVIWPCFIMIPARRTASTCIVPHWRVASWRTEATLFSTTSLTVSPLGSSFYYP